jgi:hypothetical protein
MWLTPIHHEMGSEAGIKKSASWITNHLVRIAGLASRRIRIELNSRRLLGDGHDVAGHIREKKGCKRAVGLIADRSSVLIVDLSTPERQACRSSDMKREIEPALPSTGAVNMIYGISRHILPLLRCRERPASSRIASGLRPLAMLE